MMGRYWTRFADDGRYTVRPTPQHLVNFFYRNLNTSTCWWLSGPCLCTYFLVISTRRQTLQFNVLVNQFKPIRGYQSLAYCTCLAVVLFFLIAFKTSIHLLVSCPLEDEKLDQASSIGEKGGRYAGQAAPGGWSRFTTRGRGTCTFLIILRH